MDEQQQAVEKPGGAQPPVGPQGLQRVGDVGRAAQSGEGRGEAPADVVIGRGITDDQGLRQQPDLHQARRQGQEPEGPRQRGLGPRGRLAARREQPRQEEGGAQGHERRRGSQAVRAHGRREAAQGPGKDRGRGEGREGEGGREGPPARREGEGGRGQRGRQERQQPAPRGRAEARQDERVQADGLVGEQLRAAAAEERHLDRRRLRGERRRPLAVGRADRERGRARDQERGPQRLRGQAQSRRSARHDEARVPPSRHEPFHHARRAPLAGDVERRRPQQGRGRRAHGERGDRAPGRPRPHRSR